MEVYLIRHTSVDIDSNVCYGQSNVPLSSTFEEDAQKIKKELNIDFEKVYSSPLFRCTMLSSKLNSLDSQKAYPIEKVAPGLKRILEETNNKEREDYYR